LRVEVFRVARERMRGEGMVVIVDSSGIKVMGKGNGQREGRGRSFV